MGLCGKIEDDADRAGFSRFQSQRGLQCGQIHALVVKHIHEAQFRVMPRFSNQRVVVPRGVCRQEGLALVKEKIAQGAYSDG